MSTAEQERFVDLFAENLSRSGDIARSAALLGKSLAWGRKTFRAICERLGPQAQ